MTDGNRCSLRKERRLCDVLRLNGGG